MCADVVLCAAPFMSVLRPSVALGLLQASLDDKAIRTTSLYLSIDFAARIGLDLHERIVDHFPFHLLVGDWIFSSCLDRQPAPALREAYRKELHANGAVDVDALDRLRLEAAPTFVEWAASFILSAEPKIVGFSLMFHQTVASLSIAAAIKAKSPSTVVCFGGPNCHGGMGAVLAEQYRQIDHVFTGEADRAFADFATDVLERSGTARRFARLVEPDVSTAPSMDSLPIPNYRDFFANLASMPEASRVAASIPFESARGCWWGQKQHCTFCGLNGRDMSFRSKSPNRVLLELDELSRRHDHDRFAATDNILDFRYLPTVVAVLADRAPRQKPGAIFYEVKSNLSHAQLSTMARAGISWVQPGIESLSDNVLKIMRKGVSAALNIRFLRNCREIGIGVIWNILHGFPGETDVDYARMVEVMPYLEHLQPPKGCFQLRLDRFSPNFEAADRHGFTEIEPVAAYAAIFDLPKETLAALAYAFRGTGHPLATDAAIARTREGSTRWWAAWHDRAQSPALRSVDASEGMLIVDTRSIATTPLYFLDGDETRLLTTLREPTCPDRIEHQAVLAKLKHLGLVVLVEGVAISLVTRSEGEVLTLEDRANFPLGHLRPRAAGSVRHATGSRHDVSDDAILVG